VYDLSGLVALVTGGSSGIGRAVAERVGELGATVVVGDIDRVGGLETVASVEGTGGTAAFLELDVTDLESVELGFGWIEREFGRLDIANNNAGMSATGRRTHEFDITSWDRVCDTNLRGVWLSMRSELPIMMQQGSGSIINTASVAGVVGLANSAPYAASKHGVIGLTKTAALEYAEIGIRINAVCPGIVATPMLQKSMDARGPGADAFYVSRTPMARLGKPSELADAVAWLASSHSSFVTGQSLIVDGGWTVP
jgi:NAD(P)-dependent dehydrogenase (short-subunit alcohol dehydrogenase family)